MSHIARYGFGNPTGLSPSPYLSYVTLDGEAALALIPHAAGCREKNLGNHAQACAQSTTIFSLTIQLIILLTRRYAPCPHLYRRNSSNRKSDSRGFWRPDRQLEYTLAEPSDCRNRRGHLTRDEDAWFLASWERTSMSNTDWSLRYFIISKGAATELQLPSAARN